jgi:hypothetical protein
MQNKGKEGGGQRNYTPFTERGSSGKRLLSTRGFLDDSYNEGTFWTYTAQWPGWDRKMRKVPAYGQLLAFDEHYLYGVHVFTDDVRVRRGFTPGGKGYRLFARNHVSEETKADKWSAYVPIRVRAMVLAGDTLCVAGPPDVVPEEDPAAAFEGRKGAQLWTFRASDGEKLAEIAHLAAPPVYDGLIAAESRLFISTTDGRVLCFGTGNHRDGTSGDSH